MTAAPDSTPPLRIAAEWALIFIALFLAYSPALGGGLLWDDFYHITRPEMRSANGLARIWLEIGATQQYYPVLHSAFWLEHRLWGNSLLGYHLTNVALHSFSAVLLIAILRRLAIPGALLAGVVFALHPVMVESVAWVSEQKNTLSAVFYLASAYWYVRFDETRRRSSYALASVLFAGALLSKTVTATLPAALLVLIWWRRGRIEWKRNVAPLLPWFAIAIAAGILTAWFEHSVIGARGPDFSLSLIQRCLIAGRVIWFYAAKLLWPTDLIFIYPRWTIDASAWWQYFFPVSAIAIAAGLLVLARTSRAPLAGFLFFVGTLVPVLGFLNVYPFRFAFVADHFQYLASLGLIVPLAAGLTLAVQQRGWRQAGRIAAFALVLALSVMTWRQAAIYHDAETLWRDTVARNPSGWLGYVNLGTELADQQRIPEAITAFEQAVRLKPDYPQARHDLVAAHILLGASLGESSEKVPEAILHLTEALRLDPGSPSAHLNLGNLLSDLPERTNDAIAEYEAALRIKPDYFRAHYNLGTVLMDIPERRDDAVSHLEAALQIEPDSTEARVNLAIVLADRPATVPDAIRHLEAALSRRPDLAPARELLAHLRAAGDRGSPIP